MMQTEYEFTLPKGYMDEKGELHRDGVMRLANAGDEINAMNNKLAQKNPDYMSVLLLAAVIVRLDGADAVTPELIEKLYAADFAFLQNMYRTINEADDPVIRVQCPYCGKDFTDTINFTLGE